MRSLSLILPVYNQGRFLEETLKALRLEFSDIDIEIIVVDDGSRYEKDLLVGADRLISFQDNSGKGSAVMAGVLAAENDIVIYTDVDLAYSPQFLRQLYTEVEGGAAMAYGARELENTTGWLRNTGSRFLRWLTKVWVLGSNADTQSGAKAFSGTIARAVFQKVQVKRFAFEVEVFCLLKAMDIEAVQLPAKFEARSGSSVRILKDGIRFIIDLYSIRKRCKKGYYKEAS